MLILVRRSNTWSACSLGLKSVVGKHADCRSPADRGVDADGGVAVERDDRGELTRRGAANPPSDRQPDCSQGSVACLFGLA
jgi:hypothetical protein